MIQIEKHEACPHCGEVKGWSYDQQYCGNCDWSGLVAARYRQAASGPREELAEGREHLTVSGTFQSDRYPGCPAGKVPLSVRDPLAQDLLWEYAQRHQAARKHGDSEFPRDLREALLNAGFKPA